MSGAGRVIAPFVGEDLGLERRLARGAHLEGEDDLGVHGDCRALR